MPTHEGSSSPTSLEQGAALPAWLRRLVVFVALLPVLWLALINILLWTGGAAALVSGERARSSIKLEHGWAWCVWPTVVHVQDLHLSIDGPRMQLDLEVLSGEADIELRKLLSRRFETTALRGVGATFRLSMKRPHGAEEADYAGYHRIDGMPPPTLDAEPRPVPTEEDAWEIALHQVDVGLREIQVNDVKAKSPGHLKGALDVHVAHRFALPHLELEIDRATIVRQEETLVEALSGSLTAQLAAYNPEEVRGREALRMLSAEAKIGATLSNLGVLSSVADLPVGLGGGEGELACDLMIRDGSILPGSSASYDTAQVRVSRTVKDVSLALRGELKIRAEVPDGGTDSDSDGSPLSVEANVRDLESDVDGAEESWISAEAMSASATFPRADLVDGVGPLRSGEAKLPSFTVHELAAISGIADGLWIRGGRLAGNASAKTGDDPSAIDLSFAVDVDGLSLQKGKNSLRTNGYIRADGRFIRGSGGSKSSKDSKNSKNSKSSSASLRLDPLRAKLRDLSITTEKGESSPEWLTVDRAELDYTVDTSRLSVEVRGQIADLRSLLAHLRPGEDIFQRLPERGLGTEPLDFDLSLTKTPTAMTLDLSRLQGGPLDAVAAIASGADETRIAVHLKRIGIGILSAGNGSRNLKLAVDGEWFAKKKRWVEDLGGSSE